MTTFGKAFVALVVAVIAVAIYGAYQFPKTEMVLGSAAGSTFSNAKIAAITISPATLSATTTSILNTDASARWVDGAYADCTGTGNSFTTITGAGLASWTLQVATTSVANLGLQGSTNYAANITVSTSTAISYNATTSPINGNTLYYWPPGVYMTFFFNATNTAACVVGVSYSGS